MISLSSSQSSESSPGPQSRLHDVPVDADEIVHAIDGVAATDELTPLLAVLTNTTLREDEEVSRREQPRRDSYSSSGSVVGVISVLLIGCFVSQVDGTLVLASYSHIASQFGDLENGSWLMTAFTLAMCVTQPLYGKLSDIYGRKRCLQAAYVLFALGTAGCGLGQSLWQVVAARVVQGAGASGMSGMVSILLTDLVPLHDVAAYRSYINVVQTAGRSCGGAIGGYAVEKLGWRWALLCQFPPTVVAIALVEWKLYVKPPVNSNVDETKSKWSRIDFGGIFFLSITILSGMLVLELGGQKYTWSDPFVIGAVVIFGVAGISFGFVEKYWAKEPVFPLHLLTQYSVATAYLICLLQIAAQMALMYVIPPYFQITQLASISESGVYLIPSVFGNTIGGLLSGAWINRTGRYKIPTVIASVSSMVAFTSLSLTWRGSGTNFPRALLVFPAGFGAGIVNNAVFIGLMANVAETDLAIAASGLYLCSSVGSVSGMTAAAAIFQSKLASGLNEVLDGRKDKAKVINKILSDIRYTRTMGAKLRAIVIPAFVRAFQMDFVFSLSCVSIALVIGLLSREKRLPTKHK